MRVLLIFWFFLLSSLNANADVTITGTRIIFPATEQNISIQLNNGGDKPSLIQAWLDTGNSSEIPESSTIPFVLMPTLTRIEPAKGQKLRLIAKDNLNLATDRETLFWFNILDIAPSDATENSNQLQISVRSRIKLFYRPDNLPISANTAFGKLEFSYSKSTEVLEIKNPTPYYVTVYRVFVNENLDESQAIIKVPFMLEPFSSVKNSIKLAHVNNLTYQVIDDLGAYIPHKIKFAVP